MNGTKIANRTVPLFWYPFIWVPSTAKGTKRVELNSLQKLIGLLELSLVRDKRGESFSFTHSALLCSAYYIRVRKQYKKNITVYFIILYFHTDKPFLNMRSCLDLCNVIAQKPT